MGRPSKYTNALADKICGYIAEGMSVREVCRQKGMPCKSAIFRWISENDGFSDQYARAKEVAIDCLTDELLEIADDATNDWIECNDAQGNCIGYRFNGEAVQRSKLRVDARKWALSKLIPKKYGERFNTRARMATGR